MIIGAVALAFFVTTDSGGVLLVANFFTGLGITGLFAGLGPWSAEMMHRGQVRGFVFAFVIIVISKETRGRVLRE